RGTNPYPGLACFEESHAGVFFGRDNDVRRVVRELEELALKNEPRLVTVIGPSGCGKSSLVRAGVIPALKRSPEKWAIVEPFVPGRNGFVELTRVLNEVRPDAEKVEEWSTILREVPQIAPSAGVQDPKRLLPVLRKAFATLRNRR